MNEIEKMMQNANVKKDWNSTPYGGIEEYYPPFTAEKQIYLIKFLSDKAEYLGIHYDRYKGLFEMQTDVGGLSIKNEFEEALASRVNVLWQSLTSVEKQQVKGILE